MAYLLTVFLYLQVDPANNREKADALMVLTFPIVTFLQYRHDDGLLPRQWNAFQTSDPLLKHAKSIK